MRGVSSGHVHDYLPEALNLYRRAFSLAFSSTELDFKSPQQLYCNSKWVYNIWKFSVFVLDELQPRRLFYFRKR
jgi:hypothetical protein